MPIASNRFLYAMLGYGALAACAFFTLSDKIRIFVLIFLAAMALMTWSAMEREKLAAKEREESASQRSDPR